MQDNKRNFRVVEGGASEKNRISGLKNAFSGMKGKIKDKTPAIKGKLSAKSVDLNKRKRMITGILLAIVVVAAAFFLLYLQKYTEVRILKSYRIENASDSSYRFFGEGLLKYGKDGASYLNKKGQEKWNQPYQIKNPTVVVNGELAAVADVGGNTINVFEENGLKGEIETTLTIEKIAMSRQGIVAALLTNGTTPKIVCYDYTGNTLVELQASFTGTGYPLNISLSDDGKLLQVVYLKASVSGTTSHVAYYNFGTAGQDLADHLVAEKDDTEVVYATGFFMENDVSVLVGNTALTFYKGASVPKEKKIVDLDGEVQGVCWDESHVCVVTKRTGKSKYKLIVYNSSGSEVLTESLARTYKNMKISSGKIILYEGKECEIFTMRGRHRFEGVMQNSIMEITPKVGLNTYTVIDANGIETIQLKK